MNKKIVSQMAGGIGNQMFQYATAYAVAKRNNYDLELDLSSYHEYQWLGACDFELHKLLSNICVKRYFYEYFLKLPKPFDYIGKRLRKITYKNSAFFYEKKYFYYDKDIMDIKPDTIINGYFQSYKFFENIEKEIKNMFGNFPLSDAGKDVLKQIKSQENSVALHYRDFEHLSAGSPEAKKIIGEIDSEYCKKAILIIQKKYKNATINVFSNQPENAKKVLKGINNINFIEYDFIENWEDMVLMKNCHHNIIANSSYSWWSAYLNENPNKIVIAPKSWGNLLKGRQNNEDLLPPEWIRV